MSNRRLELSPTMLLNAYAAGVFPMADSADDPEIYLVDPAFRGVIPFESFHVSRSLAKTIRRRAFEVTVNRCFEDVLDGCAAREETWINAKIRALYTSLHEFGYAHSVEVWMEGELAGGLYGVTLGGAYFGESMFSARRDGSKIALVYLMARLRAGGYTLVDTQFVTEHLRGFGAVEITRSAYHRRLAAALDRDADFLTLDPETPAHEVLQLTTQKS